MNRILRQLVVAVAFVVALGSTSIALAAPSYTLQAPLGGKKSATMKVDGYQFKHTRTNRRGGAKASGLTVVRSSDHRSPDFMNMFAKGQILPSVTLRFGEGKNTIFTITLKKVVISEFSHVAEKGRAPTESITLNFEEIVWTAKGPGGKSVTKSWRITD